MAMREFLTHTTTPFRRARARTEPVEHDAADLGTAFGLDLSMAPEEPAEATGLTGSPAAPVANPVDW
jgi:hypothetical protein